MKIKKYGIVLILLFLFSFYFVSFGPFSSRELAKHNNGYGTFDMKKYNLETVQEVLSTMDREGFDMAGKYYLSDGFFVIMLFIVQCQLGALAVTKRSGLLIGMNVIAGIRGALDSIENILLFTSIHSYPKIKGTIVYASSAITRVKFIMMSIWILMFVGVLLWRRCAALKTEKAI